MRLAMRTIALKVSKDGKLRILKRTYQRMNQFNNINFSDIDLNTQFNQVLLLSLLYTNVSNQFGIF